MKRNFLMLSDLSPEMKKKLDNQKAIAEGLRKYLQIEEQACCQITSNKD